MANPIRSPNHLFGAARSHLAFEEARGLVGDRPLAEHLDLVADAGLPLPARAVQQKSGRHRGFGPVDLGSVRKRAAAAIVYGIVGGMRSQP